LLCEVHLKYIGHVNY